LLDRGEAGAEMPKIFLKRGPGRMVHSWTQLERRRGASSTT
jgi:hypothetical protein